MRIRIRAYHEIVAVHFNNGTMQSFVASEGSTRVEGGRMYFSATGEGIASVSTACFTAVYVNGSRIF